VACIIPAPMPSVFWTALSLFFVALFVLGVVAQLRTWRKQRAVRPWMIVLGQAAAFASMVAFSVLTARPPGLLAWVLLLGLGGLAGLVYGRFVRVVRTAAGVQMSYTLPWIVTWSVLMVLTQLNAVLARRVPVVLYGFAIVNLGMNLGMYVSVLRAYRRAAALAAGLALGLLLPTGANAVGGGYTTIRAATESEIPTEVAPAYVLLDGRPGMEYRHTTMVSPFDSSSSSKQEPVALVGLARSPAGGSYVSLSYSLTRTARATTTRGTGTDPFEGSWYVAITWYESAGAAREALARKAEQNARLYEIEKVDVATAAVVKRSGYPTGAPSDVALVQSESALVEWAAKSGYFDGSNAFDLPGGEQLEAVLARLPRLDVPRFLERHLPPPVATGGTSERPPEARRRGQDARAGGGSDRPATTAPAERREPRQREREEGTAEGTQREERERPPDGGDENPPLAPEDAAAAVALSSLTLLGGSLLQLLPGLLGSRPIGAATVVPPPPPAPPVDPDEAYAQQMEAQGYRYSDRDGWVTDDQAREYQAQRDRAWQEHLKQDAELARIEGEIRKAREAQEAARAAQAEYDKKLQLMERQQELEREQAAARAELQQADWAGRAVDAVQMAADTAIGEIAEVTGPVGQAIRAGYNATKGMATVVGEAIAEGRGLKPADIRRGLVLGVENIAMDMGMDAAGRKLTGQPGLFAEAAEAGGKAARVVEEIADPKLAKKADDMRKALASGDTDVVLKLYEKHGMKDLAELEKLGHISKEEAIRLNAALSKTVDRAVDRGTRETLDLWEKGNPGVRLKEVLVADSGSSAVKGKTRSVLTDFDRTTVPVFDADDVRQYAANRGITPAQAHQELTNQFKSIHEKAVGDALPGGLNAKDVDYKSYGGFGAKAGQSDAYPSGFATTRQATQGTTTVYPPGGGRPHPASREACVDQWDMEIAKHGGPGPAEIGPRIAPQEFPGIAHEQVKAIVEKGDPKSVAKAVDRLAYMGQRSEVRVTGHAMDEGLVQIAAQVKKNPQDVAGVLERAGVTEEEFARRAFEEARRLEGTVAGWDRPPVGG